jgi:hypothetical protein
MSLVGIELVNTYTNNCVTNAVYGDKDNVEKLYNESED